MKDIQIYAFADEAAPNIDGQIAAMKRNGLNGLEIRNVDGENVSVITLEKAKEVRRKLADNGLIAWSVGSPIGKINIETGDFSAHLEKYRHTLEIARTLGAENLRMFSFFIPREKNPSDYKNEVIDRLGILCELARGSGVSLCHENEKGIYGDVPERCLALHRALPELKAIFDPANYVQCGVDTLHAWELLGDRIFYMHIKDAKTDGTVVPAGHGDGNVRRIVERYLDGGGCAFTIEPHLRVFEGFSHLERKGETSRVGEFGYKDSDTAFDAACAAFRNIL